jgi:hypothetical protein
MKLFQHKKGDGLSLNVIVMAVIAVLVLAVLSFIFINNIQQTDQGLKSCASNQCVTSASQCGGEYPIPVPQACNDGGGSEGNYCCVKLGGSE